MRKYRDISGEKMSFFIFEDNSKNKEVRALQCMMDR